MDHINPDASWNRLISAQPAPTRELFDSLFAEGDREKIILATLPLIRRYNNAPEPIRDDVEMFVIGAVTKSVDELLQHPNENPGSYLLDVITGSIHDAKFGTRIDARKYVSSNRRIYRPRKRKSDAERDQLIRQLQQQGHSPQMIDAELASRGFDKSRIVTTETEWPMVPDEETGKPVLAQFGAEQPAVDDRWELLGELCNDEELMILELLSHGHTRDYVAKAIGCHESTITRTVAAIRAKVQSHEDD